MLSRRDFFHRLAATATVLALDPFRGVSIGGDLYANARLGLRLTKPPGWEFSSIADFAALRERQTLQGVLAGEPHELRDPANLPVFLFECPAYRNGPFAPAIGLYDDPLRRRTPADQAKAHRRMLDGFSTVYRELRIQVEPHPLMLTGATATRSEWSYLHEIEGEPARRLRIRSLLVFREPRVHTYHFVDDHIAPRIAAEVWRDVERSMVYEV